MRHLFGAVAFTAMAAGTIAAPAFAGFDEGHQNSFWASQSSGTSAETHQGPYLTMDPRDAKVDATAPTQNAADASNPYFNHAAGTMSGPAVAAPAAAGDARYTATYHQPYLQIEPRDQKVAPRAGVDANDTYFYHSMGTMSHP